nr:8634_t:CDS:2 [Entrophospora candida]
MTSRVRERNIGKFLLPNDASLDRDHVQAKFENEEEEELPFFDKTIIIAPGTSLYSVDNTTQEQEEQREQKVGMDFVHRCISRVFY